MVKVKVRVLVLKESLRRVVLPYIVPALHRLEERMG